VVNNLVVNLRSPRADREIALDVLSALHNCNSVLEEFPEVTVGDGIATLYGRCRWDFQRTCAERVALSIVGVKRVVNRISVGSIAKIQSVGVVAADLRAIPEAS
jgi:osmotically-inducible protein OsmY